jgi:hypothetical protein
MEKKGLFVRISEDILIELKILAAAKYGSLKGGLSKAVEEAIMHYLSIMKEDLGLKEILGTHSPIHKIQSKQAISTENKVKQKILAIIKNLKEKGIENEFSVADWHYACYQAGFSDYRTINKYLNIAEKLGFIKNVRPGIFKLVEQKHE